jgi:hypothetical protein
MPIATAIAATTTSLLQGTTLGVATASCCNGSHGSCINVEGTTWSSGSMATTIAIAGSLFQGSASSAAD